jgi:hypothetical protein
LNSRWTRFVFSLWLLSSSGVCRSLAQAPIDPSLPEQPLSSDGFAVFPSFDVVQQTDMPVAPLAPHQKFELAARSIANPTLLFRSAFVTGFDEAANVGPDYGPGAGGAAELFGYDATNLSTTYFFSEGLLPVVFHQDPRYFRKGSGTVKSRVWWAARSEFVGFSDKGQQMPNYSVMLGYFMSTALSAAYLPPRNVSVGKTFEGYGIKLASTWGFNILHEYGGAERLKQLIQKRRNKADR